MILDFERVSVSSQSVTVGGGVENWDKRDYVGIVDGNEFVRLFVLPQVLELVNHYVHCATPGFFIQLLVESRC